MKIKSKDITVCAVAVALMFALAWMPVAAFLIPVLFVACSYRYKHGLIVGVFAGCVCLMYSMLLGGHSLEIFAVLSAIMILPRILVGLFASLAFWGAKKLFKGSGRVSRVLPYNIAATVGVLTNSVLVITALVLFLPSFPIGETTAIAAVPLLIGMGAAELVAVNLLIPTLCLTAGKALKIGGFAPKLTQIPDTQDDEEQDPDTQDPPQQGLDPQNNNPQNNNTQDPPQQDPEQKEAKPHESGF
ncbi:MAG: hypothetical protein FWH03_07645 [Firmicutes bacterium]|nr:hypothetical protein [Bacillota bacterium]